MDDVEIQYATKADLEKVVPLFQGYLQFYGRQFEEQEVMTFIKKRLTNDDAIILYAEHEGKAIGFTQLYPSFSSLALKRAYILNDLFVEESHRKLGAARALMEEAFVFCEQMGAAYITLETHPDNVASQKLYEDIGMQRDDEYWHYTKEFK